MLPIILGYAKIIAICVVGAVLGIIVMNVAVWLGTLIYQQVMRFIEWASGALAWSILQVGRFLTTLICGSVSLLFSMIWAGLMRIYQPCFLGIQGFSLSLRQYVKLRELYWKYGRHEFPRFAQFRRHMLGEEEPPKKEESKPAAPEKSTYAQALEALGFAEDQVFDKAQLKARYRELAMILHPDKGFPNSVFMQQINDAVDCIKRAKKWK